MELSISAQIAVWWLLFGGTHILGSTAPVRSRLVGALGLIGFKAVYSLVALATFIPLVVTYWGNRHEGEMLFDPPGWAVHTTETLMFFALAFMMLGFARPSPSSTVVELAGSAVGRARGIQRVTRHPMNTGFGLFGLAHMLVNPTSGDQLFWGGFVLYALLSALHQDRRSLASGPEGFAEFHAETSLVPFVAVLTGRQRIALREIPWWVVLLAAVLTALLRFIHPSLIGGF